MKIAYILNYFLPHHIAGTEVYALNLGKVLKAVGHEIIFIIPNYGSLVDDEYKVSDMRVIKYAEPSRVDKELQMGKRNPDGLAQFIGIIEREKPDIIHFHELAGSNGITYEHVDAAKKRGFKTVMTFHLARYTTSDVSSNHLTNIFDNRIGTLDFYASKGLALIPSRFLYGLGLLLKFLKLNFSRYGSFGTALAVPLIIDKQRKRFETLVKNCDALVTIAKWYRHALIDIGFPPDKLLFIEQGIDFNSLENQISRKLDGVLNIVFIGRISHFKGILEVIEVVKNLENVQMDIYGGAGEDRKYISISKVAATNTKNITMMGPLNPDQVMPTISKYDLFLLPSTVHEMSPLVIRESFAAGVPVLASDSMGSKEQITEGKNGWFFKMNNWEDLRRKLMWLVQNPEKIKEACHFPSVRTFKEVAEEYENIYQAILPIASEKNNR